MQSSTELPVSARVPIKDGLLCGSLADLATVRLAGSRCTSCGETTLGDKAVCANCGSTGVSPVALSSHGILWSFTVVRHRPPGNYKGPDPFEPFGLGLVELPDGLRVFSPVTCPIDELRIGAPLAFKPYVRVEPDGREVVAFTFVPAEGSAP
jgi:uncharacterized OB-fold protein